MHISIFLLVFLALTGCISTPKGVLPPAPSPTHTFMPATATLRPTEQASPPTVTVTPTQNSSPTASPTTIPVCVTIFYEDYAQVEIFSPQGIRVLVDVYDPGLLSAPASEKDILLTTHTHWDHVSTDFQGSFPGEQLLTQAGTIEAGDAQIEGIPSAHNAGDTLLPEGGTNYIYSIDMGGIRIAHFGDIGQDSLTPEQLDSLGHVDIAITQFANPYSDMSAENQKGVKLMQQIAPRLIIPTHINLDSATLATEKWQGLFAESPTIEVCASDLAGQPQILFLGQSANQFAERLNLVMVDW